MSVRNKQSRPAELRLLDDIVLALIRRHQVQPEDLSEAAPTWDSRVAQLCCEKAKKLQPETLGRIIYAVPDADLYGCHGRTWLGKDEAGPFLLQQLAATAMLARMRYHLGVGFDTCAYSEHQQGFEAA